MLPKSTHKRNFNINNVFLMHSVKFIVRHLEIFEMVVSGPRVKNISQGQKRISPKGVWTLLATLLLVTFQPMLWVELNLQHK